MPGSTSGQQASSQGSRQQQGRHGKDQGAEAKWAPVRPQCFTDSVTKWKGSASSWAVKESSPKVAAPSSRFFAVAGSNWKHPQVHLERPVTHGDEEVEGEGEEEQEDEDPHEEAEEEQRTQVPAPKRQAFLPPQKKKKKRCRIPAAWAKRKQKTLDHQAKMTKESSGLQLQGQERALEV